ncbi:MAG: ATP-binding protein [Clostridia bacterium]
MKFQDLIGQEQVKKLLSDSIQTGRVGHAYLFCGPDGIGRKTMALCFAEALSCESGGTIPCGRCEACILNQSGTNPDIIRIRPQEGKATVGVEEVRSVQDEISTAPRFGKYKILLFEHAEKMTVQAQNALLKTLEEPPAYVIMILLCANNAMLLDTVKSRAVRIDFKRNTDAEILEAFQRAYGRSAPDKYILCEYADGIIGRALQMANPEQYEEVCDKILQSVGDLPDGGGRALCVFENLFAAYADRKEIFFFTLYSLFRDIAFAARYEKTVPLQNARAEDRIRNLSGRIGYHNAMECVGQIDRAWRLVGQNVNYKLAADALAIRIQEVIHD